MYRPVLSGRAEKPLSDPPIPPCCAIGSHVQYARFGALESRAMPILYVSGDLFNNAYHAQAFAHGCNCQGSMGAGVAKTIRARYPEMYEEYRRRCKAEPRQFNLGDCWLWKADD